MLENPPPGADEDIIKWAVGSLYSGAIDTTASTMSTFLLQMTLRPDIQEKARMEIDKVISRERLPSLQDRKKLPYVEAVVKEVMRWYPITPMGLPYEALDDFHYRDWVIPKGSIVLANLWAISRDPKSFTDPDQFKPERFLENTDLPDPRRYFFGFGRRICPGQHLADIVLWTAIATTLATVKISKVINAEGEEISPLPEYSGGTVSDALPFPYRIEPRSASELGLLQDGMTDVDIL